jgi:hypothetical protein
MYPIPLGTCYRPFLSPCFSRAVRLRCRRSVFQQAPSKVAEIVLTKLTRIVKPTVAARYLSVQQAAEYCGTSKASFEYWMSKDLFPIIRDPKRIDRVVKVDREDLDKFMAGRKA